MANSQPQQRYSPRAQDFHGEGISVPVIPHSAQAEESVLGSILINPECLHEVSISVFFMRFPVHASSCVHSRFFQHTLGNKDRSHRFHFQQTLLCLFCCHILYKFAMPYSLCHHPHKCGIRFL